MKPDTETYGRLKALNTKVGWKGQLRYETEGMLLDRESFAEALNSLEKDCSDSAKEDERKLRAEVLFALRCILRSNRTLLKYRRRLSECVRRFLGRQIKDEETQDELLLAVATRRDNRSRSPSLERARILPMH